MHTYQRIHRSVALASLLSAVAANDGMAQDPPSENPDAVLAGHSYHGETFNEGPRQKAYRITGTGDVHFPISTEDPQVQAFFEQGVGQLHGFWYFEAERSFRQAAAMEPELAMAYWGMAMANFQNEKRARGFIDEAVQRKDQANRREQLWIEGYAAYLDEKSKDRPKRRREFIRSLETILHEFPDDVEAKAFLAVRLWQFNGDLPIPSYQAVDALLDQVFEVQPMHPAHHYRIHLWDREKPERALRSAARGGQASPAIAHMWHMPGHIFSRLKRYADAAWQQEASARVDHAHMMRDRVLPDQIHNFAHNNEWLIRNLSHIGRVHDAVDLAKNMIELPRHPTYNTLSTRGRSASYGRQRLFELLERYELWDDMIALAETVYLEPTDLPEQQIKRIRALGVAWFEKGDLAKLREQIEALRERRSQQREARKETTNRKRSREASKAKDDGEPTEPDEAFDTAEEIDRRLDAIRAARIELQGYEALLEGDPDRAWELFDELKTLDTVRLSRLHLRTGHRERALELAAEAAEKAENEVVPLANYVDVAYRCGQRDLAEEKFADLRANSAHLDIDMPAFRRLGRLATNLGLSDDWRAAPVALDDVGDRPDLDSLGPFRWRPWPAPMWRLPRGDGRMLSLEDWAGRPVIVIFYLGSGCLHCVEQLQAFAPMTREFAQAGISLVAISTENERDVNRGVATFNADGEFPFPLVSNWQLDVFKAYRAFDDFEDQPLHGTFLIDEGRRVRWQDISYEPFTQPEFLLTEARRLLRQPISVPVHTPVPVARSTSN